MNVKTPARTVALCASWSFGLAACLAEDRTFPEAAGSGGGCGAPVVATSAGSAPSSAGSGGFPSGPFGTTRGSIIADYALQGFADAAESLSLIHI